MATKEPLVRFYDLSGPKPWSPACWYIRYALNYKQIPYTVTKLSYPAIRPKCEELSPDMTGLEATVPIIEILQAPYKALNDSTPIVNLLNERFTEKDGYKNLRDVDKLDEYRKSLQGGIGWPIIVWVIFDVYSNALDPNDGSKEFFRRTREESMGVKCEWLPLMFIEPLVNPRFLKSWIPSLFDTFGLSQTRTETLIRGYTVEDFTKEKIGTEEQVLEEIKKRWKPLHERMKNEDGSGDRMSSSTFAFVR